MGLLPISFQIVAAASQSVTVFFDVQTLNLSMSSGIAVVHSDCKVVKVVLHYISIGLII